MKVLTDFEFDKDLFSGEVNKTLLYDCLKWQLARKRLGTVLCRNRALVSGTTAKCYRQKGTGRARHGDLRANIFVGGGKAFGPKPRLYNHGMPKLSRRKALLSILNLKKNEGNLSVVEGFSLKEAKTKLIKKELDSMSFNNGVIVVDRDGFESVNSSARNIPNIKVLRTEELNPFDLLRHEKVVFTREAMLKVQEVLRS